MVDDARLSIGEVADRTGIPVPTLRAWERRFSFPTPQRQPSGHRRYTEADCAGLLQVLAERQAGHSLASAIERARATGAWVQDSVTAGLRTHPGMPAPSLVSRRTMRALSHAVEDAASAAAGRPVLAAAFQSEEAYRRSQHRWDDLAAGAEVAAVLATFGRRRQPGRGAAELCLPPGSPLRHEWVVAAHGPAFTACLAGWERPTPLGTPDRERLFEAVWTVDPVVARTTISALLAADPDADPSLGDRARAALERPLRPWVGQPTAVVALANRMVAYAAR